MVQTRRELLKDSVWTECVLEPSGFLRCPRSNSLYGSSCLMADCVKVLNSPEVGLSMSECVRLCRDNPLSLLQFPEERIRQ